MIKDDKVLEELREWRSGKLPILWMFAETAVFGFDMLFEACRNAAGEAADFPELSHRGRSAWIGFYGDHRLLRAELVGATGYEPSVIAGMLCVLDCLNWFGRAERSLVHETLGQFTAKDCQLIAKYRRRAFPIFERAHDNELLSRAGAFSDHLDGEKLISSPAFRFLANVEVMSWLHFGKFSSTLLYRATRRDRPDFKAITQLIRLDARVMEHPRMAWLLNYSLRSTRNLVRERVAKAVRMKPLRLKRPQLKMRVAALISAMANALGVEVNEPQLRQLWGIAAKYRKDVPADEEWPASNEAASKGLQRQRPVMRGLLSADSRL